MSSFKAILCFGLFCLVSFSDTKLLADNPDISPAGEESDDRESAADIPSWRSFDQWLRRSGLKLSAEQSEKLDRIRQELDRGDPSAPTDSDSGSSEIQKSKWRAYHSALTMILTPEQLQRIRKLWYQFRGMTALGDDEVAEKLELTEDQRKKIGESLETFRSDRKRLVQETRKTGKTGRKIRREQLADLRETRDRELDRLLTPEQKKRFESLGEDAELFGESLPVPKLADDFIELGDATDIPPQ